MSWNIDTVSHYVQYRRHSQRCATPQFPWVSRGTPPFLVTDCSPFILFFGSISRIARGTRILQNVASVHAAGVQGGANMLSSVVRLKDLFRLKEGILFTDTSSVVRLSRYISVFYVLQVSTVLVRPTCKTPFLELIFTQKPFRLSLGKRSYGKVRAFGTGM